MTDKEKHSIKDIEKLAIETFKNIIEGSRSINGVTWNRIKNYKRKDQIQCLKQLSQQKQLYGFFIMLPIKTNINKICINCNKKFITCYSSKKFCLRKCCLDYYKKTGKRKESLKKYRLTKNHKKQQEAYRLSKKGLIKFTYYRKIVWQNVKLARSIKRLKLKGKKINKKQSEHLERFKTYIDSINKAQRNYRSKAKNSIKKKLADKKYYSDPINKKKLAIYRKKFYSTKEGKAKMNANSNRRRASKLNAIVSWTNIEKIKEIYKNCPKGYHVDHIIPLQGENVSGLHVENNLQYLTAKQNISKGNKLLYDK